MFARCRSPLRCLSAVPPGPFGAELVGDGPVGVPTGGRLLADRGPDGGALTFVWIGGGCEKFAMRDGCMPAMGPFSAAGVEGCEPGVCRSAGESGSWRDEESRKACGPRGAAGDSLGRGGRPAASCLPGAVKLRPPLPAGPLGARGPEGVSGFGPLRRPYDDSCCGGPISRPSLPRAGSCRDGVPDWSKSSRPPPPREARGPVGACSADCSARGSIGSCLPFGRTSRSFGLGSRSCLRSLSLPPLVSSAIIAARAGLMAG